MSRLLSASTLAAILILVAPQIAEAQEFRHTSHGAVVTPAIDRIWSGLDFGARIVQPDTTAPAGRGRSMFASPTQESPWRHVPVTRGHRGDLAHAFTVEVPQFAAPIDCAMAKPGDPMIDPKIIRPTPRHGTHSGVMVPVAPCRGR